MYKVLSNYPIGVWDSFTPRDGVSCGFSQQVHLNTGSANLKMLSRTNSVSLTALGAANIAFAQTNITADACADPSAFTSCTAKASAASTG
jgi:hypothetical protein